jgi:hypothetical protein
MKGYLHSRGNAHPHEKVSLCGQWKYLRSGLSPRFPARPEIHVGSQIDPSHLRREKGEEKSRGCGEMMDLQHLREDVNLLVSPKPSQ